MEKQQSSAFLYTIELDSFIHLARRYFHSFRANAK